MTKYFEKSCKSNNTPASFQGRLSRRKSNACCRLQDIHLQNILRLDNCGHRIGHLGECHLHAVSGLLRAFELVLYLRGSARLLLRSGCLGRPRRRSQRKGRNPVQYPCGSLQIRSCGPVVVRCEYSKPSRKMSLLPYTLFSSTGFGLCTQEASDITYRQPRFS